MAERRTGRRLRRALRPPRPARRLAGGRAAGLGADPGRSSGPERLTETWRVLEGSGVLASVTELAPRFATEDELRLAHTEAHVGACSRR